MGWLMALVLLMAGAFVGMFVASLMMMARHADDAMADLWDDEHDA
jgi:hypothetical protein